MLDELTFGFPLLSLLLFFPLVGAMILWLIEDEDLLKSSALGISRFRIGCRRPCALSLSAGHRGHAIYGTAGLDSSARH